MIRQIVIEQLNNHDIEQELNQIMMICIVYLILSTVARKTEDEKIQMKIKVLEIERHWIYK